MRIGALFVSIILVFSFDFSVVAKDAVTVQTEKELNAVQHWFKAWELVSKSFNIDNYKEITFVFFDDSLVYSNSRITVPDGDFIIGPSLFNKTLPWKKKAHSGKIMLPDSSMVPIAIMSFAGITPSGARFFVMPLPEFWKKTRLSGQTISLDHLLTGIFLHEFSHSQVAAAFNDRLNELEKKMIPSLLFSDNILQDYFSENDSYVKDFRMETMYFYDAAVSDNPVVKRQSFRKGIHLLYKRHSHYLKTDSLVALQEADRLFLTMEGLGQYVMLIWLTHPEGAGYTISDAMPGVRRGGKQWSQEEGLALCMLTADYYSKENFGKLFFDSSLNNCVDLLSKQFAN